MKQINKKDDLQFPQEHVFLVDCIGSQSSHSEAAYYSSAPVASPDTIAIVTYGALRQWEERTTNATFTDAGSEHQTGFTVTLGPRPKDGEIAGNATNTWNTSFACYAEAPRFLYTREDSNCSSQYDCSHADRVLQVSSPVSSMPASTTQSILPNTTSSASRSTSHSASNSAIPSPTPYSHSQEGVAIGIGIGVTLGTIILTITTVSLLRKYWKKRRPRDDASDTTSDAEPKVPQIDGTDIYEAGGRAMPPELPGCNIHVHELEAKPRRGRLGWPSS